MKIFYDEKQIIKYIEQYDLQMILPIIKQLRLKEFESEEMIFEMGNEIDGIYLQMSGKYRVTTNTPTGKSLLLRQSKPFSIIGDIEYFQQLPIQSDVIAEETSHFLFISTYLMRQTLGSNASFLKILLSEVTYKLQSCTTASKINILSPVDVRFASLCCTLYETNSKSHFSTNELTHIASLIGTTTRHLNRILQKLEQDRIIKKAQGTVTITDWTALEKIADGLIYEY